MKHRIVFAAVLAVALACVMACGKSTPTSATDTNGTTLGPTGGNAGTGRLTLRLKDAPYSEANAFLVTFSEASVHSSERGWEPLALAGTGGPLTCNMKQLEAIETLFAAATLPAGHYTQLRLTVKDATLYFVKPGATAPPAPTTAPCAAIPPPATVTTPEDVTVPSGTIKVNRLFDIANGAELAILLDFDAKNSIHQTGNGKYMMSPVVSVVSVTAGATGQ